MELISKRSMEITLEVDDELGEVLKKRAKENGFESMEAYCCIILRTVTEELEQDTDPDEEVTERLEDLGYLN